MGLFISGAHVIGGPDWLRLPVGGALPAQTSWWQAGGASGCIAAYKPKGAASYAASKVDLSGSGHNAADISGGLGWSASGWTNGAGCVSTGVPVGVAYTAIIQFAGLLTGNADVIFGVMNAASGRAFQLVPNNLEVEYYNGDSANGIAPELLAGNLAIAGTHGFRNGVSEATLVTTTAPTGNLYVGGENIDGVASPMGPGTIIAFALYNTTLSDAQVAAVQAAMAAL